MTRFARHLLLLAWMTILAVPPAWCQEPPATAVLLFISGNTTADLPLPVREIRARATGQLHASFTAAGQRVAPADDLDRAVGRWRVRGDWSLSADFLQGIHRELGVDLLRVVHLHAAADNLALIVRTVSCPTGRLLSIQMPSVPLAGDPSREAVADTAAWLDALARLNAAVDTAAPAPGAGSPLLVAPAQGIGCEDIQTLTATASLLSLLLAEGRWALPDPGLAATTLHREGVATSRIGARGRRLLREGFDTNELLVLTMAAYGATSPGGRGDFFDEGPTRSGNSNLGDFDLALRRIDLTEGLVSGSCNLFAPASPDEGWFGIVRNRSMQTRIQNAAGDLWHEFSNASEDH